MHSWVIKKRRYFEGLKDKRSCW